MVLQKRPLRVGLWQNNGALAVRLRAFGLGRTVSKMQTPRTGDCARSHDP